MRQHTSVSRRQFFTLAACTTAATVIPTVAGAESYDSLGALPSNPTSMLTSIPAETLLSELSINHSWEASSQNVGKKRFQDGNGETYLDPAFKVIDVSEWQGAIDWDAVAETDIDGAIIRLGYGYSSDASQVDRQLARNINACNRLGIPYGVYLYSYADCTSRAVREAEFTARLIKEYDCKLTLPIFYDLEKWVWTGHTPPSSPDEYKALVESYTTTLSAHGYTNVRVYSYRSYLENELNDETILEKAAWVAEYGNRLNYKSDHYPHGLAWQYTDSDTLSGISGKVDVSAFPSFSTLAFSDVSSKTPHVEDIWWLHSAGITTGFSDGTYRGMAEVVRQDMAAFLYRLAGSPSYTPSAVDRNRFCDVNSLTPHSKEIWWLGSVGISTGFPDGTYRPMDSVKRQDMAAFLHRIYSMVLSPSSTSFSPSEKDKALFSDVNKTTAHSKEIWWLGSVGISTGFPDGTYRPMDSVKRQDMAAFLRRTDSLL